MAEVSAEDFFETVSIVWNASFASPDNIFIDVLFLLWLLTYIILLRQILNCDEQLLQSYLRANSNNERLVNLKNDSGIPAIVLAASRGHTRIVEILVASGAKVNTPARNTERTALMASCKNNFVDVRNLQPASHPWYEFLTFVSRFHSNTLYFPLKTITCLLKLGADPNAADIVQRRATHWCAISGCEKGLEILCSLGDGKIDINARDKSGYTCLMYASEYGWESSVNVLIGFDSIDRNIKSTNGLGAVDIAQWYGHEQISASLCGNDETVMSSGDRISQTGDGKELE